ncbi:MAG: type II toxin-antitoxin system RelE/ParE family toxin [Spirochaetaceae bacterium]
MDESIRELIFQNYRIIYKFENNQVTIITIFHSARLFKDNISP